VSIRCLPFDQSGTEGPCVLTGKPATLDAIFAKAY
jgi:prolyl-tRNA synthetase